MWTILAKQLHSWTTFNFPEVLQWHELAVYPSTDNGEGTTAEERPAAAEDESSVSVVGAEVYENKAFSDDTTRPQTIYANTVDSVSTQDEFVELY